MYARLTQIEIRWRSGASRTAETTMGLFRLSRPITVDARQCTRSETIATDLGFTNAKTGDWVIGGENGESYILNNEFFQRTFAPVEEQQLSCEERVAQGRTHTAGSKTYSNSPGHVTRHASSRPLCSEMEASDALSPWEARTPPRGENFARSVSIARMNRKVNHSI